MIPTGKSLETNQPADDLPLGRPRQSGFVLQWTDTEATREALKQMAEEADPVECQETLEYLMKALNETREEGGERRLFV